jgi:hypothetical protein
MIVDAACAGVSGDLGCGLREIRVVRADREHGWVQAETVHDARDRRPRLRQSSWYRRDVPETLCGRLSISDKPTGCVCRQELDSGASTNSSGSSLDTRNAATGPGTRPGQPQRGSGSARSKRLPRAALASWALAASRHMYARPSATTAPTTGPIRSIHQVLRSPMATLGPKLRGRVQREAILSPCDSTAGVVDRTWDVMSLAKDLAAWTSSQPSRVPER